jgi:MoaA/NifB/PqqE/SkfB family radical SAM enzyme
MIRALTKKINSKYYPENYLFSPEWIILGVNNVCNLHCKMCDVGTKNLDSNFAQNLVGSHPINMPIDLIKKIIDQTAIYYPNAKLGYAFTEPLVYPHLEESLQYINHKGLSASITTNALTLKHKAPTLAKTNTEVFISLDGPQDIHNEIRGHKKSFQKAIEGINELLRLNPNIKISVFCVITEWNIGHLKSFLNFFKEFPLQRIGFMHTNFTSQKISDLHNNVWGSLYPSTSSNMDEINIDQFNLDELWDEILDIKNTPTNYPIHFSPEITSKEKLIEFYHNPEKIIGKGCNDVFTNVMIKSDGSVIPSHGRCYNLTLGNIYTEDLASIWKGSVLKKLRVNLNKSNGLFPACSRCCSAF